MFRLKIISNYRPDYKNTQGAVLCKLYFGFEISNLTADMYIYIECVCVCAHGERYKMPEKRNLTFM